MKMRQNVVVLSMLLGLAAPAWAQVGINIGVPGLSIGIRVPVYPQLVLVPGYPVYYAPRLQSNFFFYDGMYWVYQGDNWYSSSWYDGPWWPVSPDEVPLFVLRVPLRYYRSPPTYFRGWSADAPPRWGEHWGQSWQQRRGGWDRWDRRAVPAPAPLPVYQRQYPSDRYPQVDRQHEIRTQNYRYQPREAIVRQHFQDQAPPPVMHMPPQRTPPVAAPARRPDSPPPASGHRDTSRDGPSGEPRDGRRDSGPPNATQRRPGQGRDDDEDRGPYRKK